DWSSDVCSSDLDQQYGARDRRWSAVYHVRLLGKRDAGKCAPGVFGGREIVWAQKGKRLHMSFEGQIRPSKGRISNECPFAFVICGSNCDHAVTACVYTICE